MVKHVLVYGSLKRGAVNHGLIEDQTTFVKEVRLPRYDLHKIGWYPGITPNPKNGEGVLCELFALNSEATVPRLDYYEGYRHDEPEHSLFRRTEVEVDGTPAYVYVYNNDVSGTNFVPSGQWEG